ncbi:MAG: bifunctional diaminohydroxyphosphoribosylaminopyrimidine deaminase/5-amino-6-(5-phosphoribosylamino)uracil reductase RibD, partial [Bacteroidia bacterium]|nr:bifunctional diaminohydroxyphosphoribosylaminopyrimidine deaminase/5-amino-6-(5-phosphoribosylamino)uracil reductase RibD [Bacteroidia bacterium]
MRRCIELASMAKGAVSPNPLVGSVIVADDKIIAEGFHKKFGSAHAEVNAIRSLRNESILSDATLYVNLEPCSHEGKTPPCSDLIIRSKLKRVVVGMRDPNKLVNGNGIKKLKDAGIE